MKKLLLLLSVVCLPLFCYSQNEHLTFKDIPIDGTIAEFVKKLEKTGFTISERHKDAIVMKGEFAGNKCELFVFSTPKTKKVWKVTVNLSKKSTWTSLKSEYQKYVKEYAAKYGEPEKMYAGFGKPYSEGDGFEMQAVKDGKAYFTTIWKTDGGAVTVEITQFSYVRFGYEDKINSDMDTFEKQSKIQGDI